MENKSALIYVLGNSQVNYNDRYAYASYLDENNNILGTSTSSLIRYGWYTNNRHDIYTLEITIPVGTKKLRFYGNKDDVSIADIKIKNEPIINPTKYYSILSENGIIQGYNNITISYDNTSEKKLYKIGENGNWQNYENKEIRLEIGEKLYTKGINKNNEETRIISEYTAIFPSDGLNSNAYNGNTNSWHAIGTGSYYILVDKSMENKSVNISVLGNSAVNYNDRYAYVCYLDENNNTLGTSASSLIRYGWYTNNRHDIYTLEITIPVGTKKLRFYGNKDDVAIANISII